MQQGRKHPFPGGIRARERSAYTESREPEQDVDLDVDVDLVSFKGSCQDQGPQLSTNPIPTQSTLLLRIELFEDALTKQYARCKSDAS